MNQALRKFLMCFTQFFYTDSAIDLVELLNFRTAPAGIEQTTGFCANREGGTTDAAFRVSSRSVASVPTAQIFPAGFPEDFSILATFKAKPQSKSILLSAYSAAGVEVLSLKIGRRLKLTYQGEKATAKRRLKFGAQLADGE